MHILSPETDPPKSAERTEWLSNKFNNQFPWKNIAWHDRDLNCDLFITSLTCTLFPPEAILMSTTAYFFCGKIKMSQRMTKPTKWHVYPVTTQISLRIGQVWLETSLWTQWVAKDPSFPHVDSKDSNQTGRILRLIWVFIGCTYHFAGFVVHWLKCLSGYSFYLKLC